jgi:hypothetical protein
MWSDPAAFVRCVNRSYRRNFWDQQPHRILVVSEKSTVSGLLRPLLHHYGVGFLSVHGFTSTTKARDLAIDQDGRILIILYVGDFDPSGLFMSEEDLPNRFSKYDGNHVSVRRIALTRKQVRALPSFPATDKRKDPRYKWFTQKFGSQCWEIDALDPNTLRACVEGEIKGLIEPETWQRCEQINRAERESLREVMKSWAAINDPAT